MRAPSAAAAASISPRMPAGRRTADSMLIAPTARPPEKIGTQASARTLGAASRYSGEAPTSSTSIDSPRWKTVPITPAPGGMPSMSCQ